MLMLINLMFVCPVDPAGKSRSRLGLIKLGLLANRLAEGRDPGTQFQKRVAKVISNDHPFHHAPSLWSILMCNFTKSSGIFSERSSSPKEWTFVLCGRLPPKDVLMPMLEKYFGSIPNVDNVPGETPAAVERRSELAMRESLTPLDIPFPLKSVREDVHIQMVDPKGSTVVYFPIQLQNVTQAGSLESAEAELRDVLRLSYLVRMLETRLVEVLRFERGQVYGVSVGTDFSTTSPQLGVTRRGTLRVSFECDPAEADELVDVMLAELDRIRNGTAPFTAENVTASAEQEKVQFEEFVRKNDFWCDTILDLYFSRAYAVAGDIGDCIALWWRVRAEVGQGLTAASAGEAFRALLPEGTQQAVITMRQKRGWWQSFKALFGFGKTPPKSVGPRAAST